MKRMAFWLVGGTFLAIIVTLVTFSTNKFDTKELRGNLLMVNPYGKNNGTNKGIETYDFMSGKSIEILNDLSIRDPLYSHDREKILFITGNCISEYNIKKQVVNKLICGSESAYYCAKYVPNKNEISYIIGNGFYIYNPDLNSSKLLTELAGDYTWDNKGENILFNENGNVCRYNLANGTVDVLFDGQDPEYSNDNKFIAYRRLYNELIVREIDTGREWTYEANGIKYYKFSPDDKFLAIFENNASLRNMFGFELKVWDYTNGHKILLRKNIGSSSNSNFDWK